MDNTDILTENKSNFSTFVVDGVIYGLMSGTMMFISLVALAILSGEAPGVYLESFSGGSLSCPDLGLAGYPGVSAIYGVLFGAFIWPLILLYIQGNFRLAGGGLLCCCLTAHRTIYHFTHHFLSCSCYSPLAVGNSSWSLWPHVRRLIRQENTLIIHMVTWYSTADQVNRKSPRKIGKND